MKKIKQAFYIVLGYIFSISLVSAANEPAIHCVGLPGCGDTEIGDVQAPKVPQNVGADFIGNVIAQMISYVAVFAVIALMISGIMYLLSEGEEEKTKKAKTWIIWSLTGVFLSISAWSIISILNTLTIK